jgi:ketosteroid isomerase-like protein
MDEHPHAAIVRRSLEAFAIGDIAEMLACCVPDVVWHLPGTGRFSGRFEGGEAVTERVNMLREAGVAMDLRVHDVVANDEHVVAMVHFHVTNEAGTTYDQPQVYVVHMREDLIHDVWLMNQDQAVLDVLLA